MWNWELEPETNDEVRVSESVDPDKDIVTISLFAFRTPPGIN